MSYWETSGQTDEWYTPKYIFDALETSFDLDVAAPRSGPKHVPTVDWLYENSLEKPWAGYIWMNPPFGGRNALTPWLEKFLQHGNGIALVPDRTSAPWFQNIAKKVDSILFLSPKVKFERPDGTLGESPSTGTALFGVGASAVAALLTGSKTLGLLCVPK